MLARIKPVIESLKIAFKNNSVVHSSCAGKFTVICMDDLAGLVAKETHELADRISRLLNPNGGITTPVGRNIFNFTVPNAQMGAAEMKCSPTR